MNNFSKIFKQLELDLINEQRKITLNSSLKVYYGITIQKYYRISFVSTICPIGLISTKEIKVTQGKESENIYWTCFDLIEEQAKDVFFIFCDSLIKSIENIDDEYEALTALKDRYHSWKLLLKNKGKMSYESYQGLFGELYFLLNFLLKNYSVDDAVISWVGPDGYSKDFSVSNSWYEIKTIGTSSNTIKINSLAQLDSNIKGHLVTIIVEKMSDEYNNGLCSVKVLYRTILDKIISHQTRELFINKVLNYGYTDEDDSINNYKFDVKSVNSYCVEQDFPRITRNNLTTNAISQVTYEIMINAIEKYAEDLI